MMEITRGCGPKAPSVLIALMCNIYSQGYCAAWGDKMARRIAGMTGVGAACAREVVHKAVQADFFDKGLFDACGVLTSRGIQRRYSEAKKLKGPGGEHWLLGESSEFSQSKLEDPGVFSEKTPQSKVDKRKSICAEAQALFSEAWGLFPNKKGKVSDAQKARLHADPGRERLLAAVRRYADEAARNGTEKRYIMHGATFFNGRYAEYLDGGDDAGGATSPASELCGRDGRWTTV